MWLTALKWIGGGILKHWRIILLALAVAVLEYKVYSWGVMSERKEWQVKEAKRVEAEAQAEAKRKAAALVRERAASKRNAEAVAKSEQDEVDVQQKLREAESDDTACRISESTAGVLNGIGKD